MGKIVDGLMGVLYSNLERFFSAFRMQINSVRVDQFYTQREIAAQCWRNLLPILGDLNLIDTGFFVEPSAGDGAFYELFPQNRRVGFDIEPHHPDIVERDFLQEPRIETNVLASEVVVVGNPPFGKRGRLAVSFFQRAAQIADTIALILPIIFQKYFIHKQLPTDFKWIGTTPLPRASFRTIAGKSYAVNTEFQIWTRKSCKHQNLRLFCTPPIAHPDFVIWQYNNTKEALKVFENEFDFAVPCQGWQDYSRRERNSSECEKHKQWMLIKSSSEVVFYRLYYDIDYKTLAFQNTTSTPGFRKGDLVREYTDRYEISSADVFSSNFSISI